MFSHDATAVFPACFHRFWVHLWWFWSGKVLVYLSISRAACLLSAYFKRIWCLDLISGLVLVLPARYSAMSLLVCYVYLFQKVVIGPCIGRKEYRVTNLIATKDHQGSSVSILCSCGRSVLASCSRIENRLHLRCLCMSGTLLGYLICLLNIIYPFSTHWFVSLWRSPVSRARQNTRNFDLLCYPFWFKPKIRISITLRSNANTNRQYL